MPKATVTVRELKNKDTCIDLSVTSYREIPGLVRSTYEYQIVVVSSLSCFKLPSHKESDVVQFTLFKKFPEFEDLRTKLNEAFAGTAFPLLVRKSIIVNETVIKERRNSLDSFVRFLAATPRIVTSAPVLTFLGVEPQKAKRFAGGETEETASQDKAGDDDKAEEEEEEDSQAGKSAKASLFEDEEEEDGDDFLSAENSAANAGDDEDDFFSSADTQATSAKSTQLFERQDLKRELTEDDEKDFAFIPDAIITKKEVIRVDVEDDENNELLNVDEDIDLDKLLTLDTDPKQQQQQHQQSSPQQDKPRPVPTKRQGLEKPSVPTKPTPSPKPTPGPKPTTGPKPSTPDKPSLKPALPAKPKPAGPKPSTSPSKRVPAEQPKPAPRKLKPQAADATTAERGGALQGKAPTEPEMSSDDIMQYIAANVDESDADLDLFS